MDGRTIQASDIPIAGTNGPQTAPEAPGPGETDAAAPLTGPLTAPGLQAPEVLAQSILVAETTAQIIAGFIDRNLKPGIDYGRTTGKRRDGGTYQTGKYLFKPGAEKIRIALGLRPRFKPDYETRRMAGDPAGLICFICQLISTSTGRVVAEGRGAADVHERTGWTINNAVKVAEKRAEVDAVLRLAGLSEHFKAEEDQAEDDRDDASTPADQQPRQQSSRSATGAPRRQQQQQQHAASGDTSTAATSTPNPAKGGTPAPGSVEDLKAKVGAIWRGRYPGVSQRDRIAELTDWLQVNIRPGATVDTLTPDEWRRAHTILSGAQKRRDTQTAEQINDDLFA